LKIAGKFQFPPTIMNKFIAILLIVVGAALLIKGVSRKDSLAGGAAEVGTSVANKVDGGGRIPAHYYYIIGGVVLMAGGIGVLARRPL